MGFFLHPALSQVLASAGQNRMAVSDILGFLRCERQRYFYIPTPVTELQLTAPSLRLSCDFHPNSYSCWTERHNCENKYGKEGSAKFTWHARSAVNPNEHSVFIAKLCRFWHETQNWWGISLKIQLDVVFFPDVEAFETITRFLWIDRDGQSLAVPATLSHLETILL